MRLGRSALGYAAEDAVANLLRARGHEILLRNVRVGHLEIDIVARLGDLVVLVEVRTRGTGSYEGALASVDGRKRRRILRAAEILWSRRLSKLPGVERVRIDVAAVKFEATGTLVEYIPGAFTV